jgi:D-lactate dehydrogenase (cytochrome)
VRPPETVTDPAILDAYLEDASGASPGVATGLVRPDSLAEASALLRDTLPARVPVLCQAARTSLTSGAVPQRDLVVSVERMTAIGSIAAGGDRATVRVDPGVRLDRLREHLAQAGWYYPPVPTYEQAMVGGTVATNAGGAATFKYGVTRQWVRGLSVLLFNGDLLEIERGQAVAAPGESFELALTDGQRLSVPAPGYVLPPLRKISAGYFGGGAVDLVDLFVGSEGTLGMIVSVTLDLVPLPPTVVTGLAFLDSPARALDLASDLRLAALRAREQRDLEAPDVRAIESIDANGLDLLRQSGAESRLRIRIPPSSRAALLFEIELTERLDNEQAQSLLLDVMEAEAGAVRRGPLAGLFGLLVDHGALETLELAFPEDHDRRRALKEFREAVPQRVNEILVERRRDDARIKKIAGDFIVPFDQLAAMIPRYEQAFADRGLEYAIWGHLSDGNLHPNALPRSGVEVEAARAAVLELAQHVVRAGGAPLSEHGVGRDSLKQELLRRFLGAGAIEEMRRIKRAIDPVGRFGRGVLFPPD